MNRAERRRTAKAAEKLDKSISIKPQELRETVEKEVENHLANKVDSIILESVANSLAVSICVLHDKFGFGKARLQRFMNEYNEIFDSILGEYLTFEDLIALAKELGVGLEVKDDKTI